MANEEHLEILEKGIAAWAEWRKGNPEIRPDLSGADLSGVDLRYLDLSNANLSHAKLTEARLSFVDLRSADLNSADLRSAKLSRADLLGANLSGANLKCATIINTDLSGATLSNTKLIEADLSGVNLSGVDLSGVDLSGATLTGANLSNANLTNADLSDATLKDANLRGANLKSAKLVNTDLINADLTSADLTGANLSLADLVETNFTDATITDCRVYGISAWNVILEKTKQKDLVISKDGESDITVDDLEVAQFIYLMLNNTKIRNVINTITSKGVLILGRFSDPQRKAVLDGLRQKLREFGLLPIVFDFDRPTDKDYTETVQTLAGMSMFVIADVTNPKSTPLELEATVKQFKIPYLPIIDVSVDPRPFAMLVDLQKSFHWVLQTLEYKSKDQLLNNLKVAIIDRAMKKRQELSAEKAKEVETLSLDDLLSR